MQFGHFIGGSSLPPAQGAWVSSINPADQSIVAEIAAGDATDVDAAVASAAAAQRDWAAMRPLERGRILIDVGRCLRANIPELAALDSREMGMPLALSSTTAKTAADYFEYYGGLAPSLHGETIALTPSQHAYTLREPYGVVAVITPWNAPLNQAARSIAPALASGNAVVHKPSEFTSLSALVFAEKAVAAGLPKGVWNVVTGTGPAAGAALVAHPRVRKAAFTGSVATGRAIGAIAAHKIMPVTLELGGKSPDIVFDDADLTAAIPGTLMGFVINSGQVCLAGTRLLVQRGIHDRFCELLAQAIAKVPVGVDQPFPTLGPLANRAQYEKVLGYFDLARREGARLLAGGEAATRGSLANGLYVKPTLYADVHNDMRIAREEIFGPVGVVIPFDSEDDAIRIANDTEYGLAAGVWTSNLSRAHRIAAQLQAGQVYVNHYQDAGVEQPMGGYKMSGIGREKGMAALQQYTQLKNVSMRLI